MPGSSVTFPASHLTRCNNLDLYGVPFLLLPLPPGGDDASTEGSHVNPAGRIENCQIGVLLGYASYWGQGLMDRALFCPGVGRRTVNAAARRASGGRESQAQDGVGPGDAGPGT